MSLPRGEPLRQREPREDDRRFLAFVRSHPCCACGRAAPSQAAHLRGACPERGKRETGMGEKPSDRWAVPLCAECHLGRTGVHGVGEACFFAAEQIDPFELAAALYAEFKA